MHGEPERPSIDIGDGFTNYIAYALAETPPMCGVIVGARYRDDAHKDAVTKGLLKEYAGSACVDGLRHNVNAVHGLVVFTEPVS